MRKKWKEEYLKLSGKLIYLSRFGAFVLLIVTIQSIYEMGGHYISTRAAFPSFAE